MGKYIPLIVVAALLLLALRFGQSSMKLADLREIARDVLLNAVVGEEPAAVERFVEAARETGFSVDPDDVSVTIEPDEGGGTIGGIVGEVMSRARYERVTLSAPVRFPIAGPWMRSVDLLEFDKRLVEARAISSLDSEPELARDLGIDPDGSAAQPAAARQPPVAPAQAAPAPRPQGRGMWGIKERARNLGR